MVQNNENKQDKTGQGFQPPFLISDQYIKALSFDNPNFLIKYQEMKEQAQVSVNVETNFSKIQDAHYEVSLKVGVKSFIGDKDIFVMEMVYAGLVTVDAKLTNDVLEPILLVHCPFLMFPFVRQIIADLTRNGGYAPLMIEPIDFASLYVDKKNKEAQGSNEEIQAAG